MPQANADRNLLFGILAMQMDFVTRDQLVAAMQAWVFDKTQPLGQILRKQGALADDTRALLDALVQKHLAQHDGDAEKSLAAISSVGSVRAELQRVADPELQASLGHVAVARPGDAELYATRMVAAPDVSASGSRFRILRPHARGGLGEVLVARDEELNREVALKQIHAHHADDRESQARFMLEAEITGGLEHPGIVPVYGLGQYADGRPYYAMRFIRGDSLKEAVERFHKADAPGRDPGARSLELRALLGRFVDVCNAIAYAHSRGVLHRDLKPGNIMLGKYGETMVVDWGLAKPLDAPPVPSREPGEGTLMPSSASLASATLMGAAIGTPQFMSPEQAGGRLDLLGPASDVYSLGATLYSVLTGTPPVTETDVAVVLHKVQRGEIVPPRKIKPSVPPALEAICRKAMALQPGDRYASARALADDVEHWLADEPVTAWREPWSVRARRWLGRHRTLVAAASAAVLAATLVLGAATVLLTAANERERAARALAEEREVEVRAQRDAVEKQRKHAEHNYQLARKAVDRYHTDVSESVLLHEPGMQPLRKKLLEAAREFYEQFVRERGQDPGVHAELGKAVYRLAQITADIDSQPKAIDLHQQARAIFASLPAVEATTPEAQSDLASTLHHLGRLYRLTDQPVKAEDAYRKALAIWEPLADANRQVDHYRADRARSQLGLGNVLQVTRRLDQAQAIYQKALETRMELARAHPKAPEFQRDLAVSHGNLAMVAAALGHKEQAATAYRAALAIQATLVRDYPQVSQYQNDLARSHFNLGDLLLRADDARSAETSYRDAAGAWDKLVRTHPAVNEFHVNLAEAFTALATAYSAARDHAKAEDACKKAMAIKEKLANEHRDTPSYQGDLARGYYQLGNIRRAAGHAPAAATAYQSGTAILEKLTHDLPGIPQHQSDLARTYNNLGLVYAAEGDKDKAQDAFGKSLALWSALARAHVGTTEFILGQSTAAYNLGNVLRSDGNAQGALDRYDEALKVLERLGPDQRSLPAVPAALRNLHWKRADALAQVARHADALHAWDRALDLAGAADRPWFQLYRTVALAHSGEHAQATAEADRLALKAGGSGEALYQLVRVYALSAGAAAADAPLAARYATRAIELLGKARMAGFFKVPANVARLQKDGDLDSLRPRAEFRTFLDAANHEIKSAANPR